MEITKKDLEKILSVQRKEYLRYNKVLIEDFDKKFDILVEGHQILNNKLEKHDKNFIAIDEKLEKIEDNIEIIKIGLRRKVDIDEFNALLKRVILLEKKL